MRVNQHKKWGLIMNRTGFFKLKSEWGRTMAEMLGLLAILGVLTIGGIISYRLAMQYYRENETFNDISVTVAGSRTWDVLERYGDKAIEEPYIIPVREVVSNVRYRGSETAEDAGLSSNQLEARELESFTTAVSAPVWVRIEHPGAFTVRVSGLSKSMCEKIVRTNMGNLYAYKQPTHNSTARDFDAAEKYLAASLRSESTSVENLCSSIDPSNSRVPPVQTQVAVAETLPEVKVLDETNNTLVLYFGVPEDCAGTLNVCGEACFKADDKGVCLYANPGRYGCPCDNTNPVTDPCLYCNNGTVAVKNTSSCADRLMSPCGISGGDCVAGEPYRKDTGKFSAECCTSIPNARVAGTSVCCAGDKNWDGTVNPMCELETNDCKVNNPYNPDKYPGEKELDPTCCTQAGGKFMPRANQGSADVGECCQRSASIVEEDTTSHEFRKKSKTLNPGNNIFGSDSGSKCCVTEKIGGTYKVRPYMLNNKSEIDQQCCDSIGGMAYKSVKINGRQLTACCNSDNSGLDFNGKYDAVCANGITNECTTDGGVLIDKLFCCTKALDGTLLSGGKAPQCCNGNTGGNEYCCTEGNQSLTGTAGDWYAGDNVCCAPGSEFEIMGKVSKVCCRAAGGSMDGNSCCSSKGDGTTISGGQSAECCGTPYNAKQNEFCCNNNSGGGDWIKSQSLCCGPGKQGFDIDGGFNSLCCDSTREYDKANSCCKYGKNPEKCDDNCPKGSTVSPRDKNVCCKSEGCKCSDNKTCPSATAAEICCTKEPVKFIPGSCS